VTPVINLTRSRGSQVLDATVTYATQTPANFGALIGVKTLDIQGTAASTLSIAKYLDFYLVLDVSGSMGIPTTAAGQDQLALVNPDNSRYTSSYPTGCNFACHFSGYSGFNYARSHNIPLRLDSVGAAAQALLSTVQQTTTVANQYRVGIYPFINDAIQAAPLSSNFTTADTVAGSLANYIDNGTSNGGMYSGGTHFDTLWNDLKPYFKTAGDGSSSTSTLPFIFLVTDGMDDQETYVSGTWSPPYPQVPSLTLCSNAKAAGYTVAVLYIPYVPIQNPNSSFWYNEDGKVNAVIPSVPAAMQSCASPGFFFTANSPADITNAMKTMFADALQAARLTN
jgi:hypothetical protein